MSINTFKFSFFSLLLVLISCTNNENTKVAVPEKPFAEQIIDQAIAKHGSELINAADISFQFRDYFFKLERTENQTIYSRSTTDSLNNTIKDTWNEEKLTRTINVNEEVMLNDTLQNAYQNSINSVFYFAFLPKALHDPAVNVEFIDTVNIKNQAYYKLRVTFDEEGGGEDHSDIFLYWINTSSHTMDYLAYQYFTNVGGIRFREAYNIQEVEGVRFQDYHNYKPLDENLDFMKVDEAFENGELKLLSEIQLENIVVN